MRSNKFFFFLALIFSIIFLAPSAYSYMEETHAALNEHITEKYTDVFSLNSYLINSLGFESGIYDELIKDGKKMQVFQWLGEGGRKEDKPGGLGRLITNTARASNHFHDPLKVISP